MQPEIREKNCKEILFQRILLAIISSVTLQFILISCIALVVNIINIITNPLSSIESTWTIFSSPKVWCYLIVVAIIIAMEGIICSKNYLNSPPMYNDSRFIIFCKLFTPYNLMIGGIYIFSGIILLLVYLTLQHNESNNNIFIQTCKMMYGICLIEEHLFLIVGGFWTGIYYYIKSNVFNLNERLNFPIIPQSKLPQIVEGIYGILSLSMTSAIWPTVYYFILYYFFGSYIRGSTTIIIYSLKLEQEPLDTIWKLFNLSLIFNMWLYISLFALTITSMQFLFHIFLTEWMQFQIGQNIYNDDNIQNKRIITLSDALSMNKVPIIQYLGYLDLVTLAQKEKYRRSILFTLSQPGGHPYNWNSVIQKCLSLIEEFSNEIIKSTIISSTKAEEQNPEKISPLSLNIQRPFFEKRELLMTSKMRNLTTAKSQTANPTIPQIIVTQHDLSFVSWQFINELIKTTKMNVTTYLLSKPLIFYLFGTPSNSKTQYLIINGQSVIWAADSISSLAVASLEEDSYGIVQKDLPSIIYTLINLKQSLDKFYKMNLLTKKPQHYDKQVRQMLTSLRVANKRSIYRITTAFKNYIDDLIFDQQLKDQLNNFFVCKE
ncbi:nucleoporin NDC1 [Chelonus insularis]|uniref:nucleoporin NDC1 n=1 Tax=Chelonus insularis TaxID=460826 RepID=UPI00158E920D|nr:nucleoporin NDC1 [Chelonus insularis]